MRQMKKGAIVINVVEHIILQNYWEYYVTDQREDNIALCLVMGFETELGDVCLNEIKPYIRSQTKDLDLLPAEGWQWVETA